MPSSSFAIYWASQLGANPLSLVRLQGGINNQVYRCGDGRQHWVIKAYEPVQPGQRDRMQAEVEFLRYSAQVAPRFTPALTDIDQERRCVVLEHLEGDAFLEGVSPSEEAVAEAVEFFRQLNSKPQLARGSINLDAAEGFLSLREHIINVRERLKCMTSDHLAPALRPQADVLLQHLDRELAHTEEQTCRLIDQGIIADSINADECCVSPSDFGFHNAIKTSNGIQFIDFEFAGWDDPAKAIVDFNLQPRVPIPESRFPLLESFPTEKRLEVLRRCKHIAPILRIKWLCIILSVLNPSRLKQILALKSVKESEDLIQNRLLKATAMCLN